MSDVLEYTAYCTACPAVYRVSEPAANRKRAAAKARNREVWMQTHCDTTGHARFEISDQRHRHVIMRRTSDADPQLTIVDDPDLTLLEIRHTS